MKHPSILVETPFKFLWNFIESFLKLPWNTLKTLSENTLETSLKTRETYLKHPLNFKLHLNFLEIPLKLFRTRKNSNDTKRKKRDGRTKTWTEWQRHFLSCSSQLKIRSTYFLFPFLQLFFDKDKKIIEYMNLFIIELLHK